MSSPATILPPEPATPSVIHSCPNCSHWLPDGTLVCPDCQTLTYGAHLTQLAVEAQQLEQEGKWPEARDRWVSALPWLPENTRQAAGIQQHIDLIDARLKAEDDRKARWTKRLGPFAPIALFLLKIKTWLFVALKFKFLFSGLLYFGIYWALYGPWFALGFTLSIFLHEMGHYVAVKMRGLKVDLPVFFPGLGAYVRWYGQGVSREDLASISLAGPFSGLITAAVFYAAYRIFPNVSLPGNSGGSRALFLVLANVGAWLNLFNLFPVRIMGMALDGAQATYALSRVQRLMISATCLLFFGLSATTGASGGELVGPHTMWTFLIVGLGMAWRCSTNDAPEKPSTRTFAYFQALVLALGFLMFMTPLPNN